MRLDRQHRSLYLPCERQSDLSKTYLLQQLRAGFEAGAKRTPSNCCEKFGKKNCTGASPAQKRTPTPARIRQSLRLPSIEQVPWRHTKRLCELLQHGDRRVPPAALDVADIGPVDPCPVGKVLLAPALLVTKLAQILAEANAYIHVRLKTAMSAIDLQTISDN